MNPQVVNDAMVKRVISRLKPGKTNTRGYCKRPEMAIKELWV